MITNIVIASCVGLFVDQSFAQTAQVPGQPTGFTATPISPTSVFLSWSHPQDNGGAPITGYKIEYRIVPATTDTTLVTLGNVTNYTHTNLVTDKTYIYRVSAINSAGTGSPTPEQLATPTSSSAPPENIVPNPPQSLTASVYSATQINLSWHAPEPNGGPAVTGYRIEYMTDSGNFTNLVSNSGSSYTAYSHTDLAPGHTYTYRVFAINSVGTSNSSNTASATPVKVDTVPGAPTLSANPSSATSISLSWIPPSNDGGTPITGYKIEYANDTSSFKTLVTNTGNSHTGYMHTGLTTGETYTYRISAINSVGIGNPSNTVTSTPQDTKTPTITSAVATSPTSARITWIAPSQTYGQTVSGYKIDQVINGNFLSIDDSIPNSVTSYTVTNLSVGKTYTFAITAKLSGGTQTNPSPTASVITTSTSSDPGASSQQPTQGTPQSETLPDPPTALNATMISQSTVKLSWLLPSNNGKLPITGFKIESKTGESGTWTTITSNTGVQTSFIKSGLLPDTIYYYRVYSISNAGTSQPTTEVSVSTQQANHTETSPPPSFTPQQSEGFITVVNTTTTVSYKITGGQIQGASINPDTFSLNIDLKAGSSGSISVQIPRSMIDAKNPDGTDDTYIVTEDQSIAQFNETKNPSYRTLDIAFPAGTDRISIYGTTAVPEFPTALIALVAAFIPAIVALRIIIRY